MPKTPWSFSATLSALVGMDYPVRVCSANGERLRIMKCRESQYWLYSFQPNAAWPADVVGHLQGCAECQQLQAQLRQIDQEVNKLTTPARNDGALEHLLQRIEVTPQTAMPKAPQSWPWLRYG